MTRLMKINDVAARYGVSTRTLRYYEEIGILWSERPDPEQPRYYAPEALRRLEQILALRRLQTPIREIERIFAMQSPAEALGALFEQLRALETEARDLSTRRELLEWLVELFRREQYARPMEGPELPVEIVALAQRTYELRQRSGSPPFLAESPRALADVKIVELAPMRVACYHDPVAPSCFAAWEHMIAWSGAYGLPAGRAFGHVSRNPEGIRPMYGYDVLFALPEGFEPRGHVEAVEFPGGLYAVTTTWYRECREDWRSLARWVAAHPKYTERPGLFLEELSSFSIPVGEDSLVDLLYPVEPRIQEVRQHGRH